MPELSVRSMRNWQPVAFSACLPASFYGNRFLALKGSILTTGTKSFGRSFLFFSTELLGNELDQESSGRDHIAIRWCRCDVCDPQRQGIRRHIFHGAD